MSSVLYVSSASNHNLNVLTHHSCVVLFVIVRSRSYTYLWYYSDSSKYVR